jgi:hypothetical protein
MRAGFRHARDRVQWMDAPMQLPCGWPWSAGVFASSRDGGVRKDSAIFFTGYPIWRVRHQNTKPAALKVAPRTATAGQPSKA